MKQTTILVFVCLSLLCQIACGNDEPNVSDKDRTESCPPNYEVYSEVYNSLVGTSWALANVSAEYGSPNINKYIGETITFTSEEYIGMYKFYSSLFPATGYGVWEIKENGDLWFTPNANKSGLTDREIGGFVVVMGTGGEILTHNRDRLVLQGINSTYYYNAVAYTGGNGSGNSNTGGSSYEKPEIGLEDYTCSTNSITVKYRIYNQSEAKVTSATGYYGTTSPTKSVSGDVSGSLITIRFTGLQKGTDYYIKCTAKGAGGSTTSETTRLPTYY